MLLYFENVIITEGNIFSDGEVQFSKEGSIDFRLLA